MARRTRKARRRAPRRYSREPVYVRDVQPVQENPLSGLAIGLLLGGVAVVGTGVYFVYKAKQTAAAPASITAGAVLPPTPVPVAQSFTGITNPVVLTTSSSSPVLTDQASIQSAGAFFNTIATAQVAAGGDASQWTQLNMASVTSGSDINFFSAMQYFQQWANGQISSGNLSIPNVTPPLRTDGQLDAQTLAALTYFASN